MESRSLKIAFLVALLTLSLGFEASGAVAQCNVNSDCAKYHYSKCTGQCVNYFCAGHTCYCTCHHSAADKVTLVTLHD